LENILEKINLKEIQANNSIVPTPIPQLRPSNGDSGKPHPANAYNPPQGKINNPAPVFMSTPAPAQGHIPSAIPQRFPVLTPTPVKEVQPDSDKNTPINFTPVSKPIPSATAVNYDINRDGSIDANDMKVIDNSFNTLQGNPNFNPAADLNGDGAINMPDRMLLMAYFSIGRASCR
jgi:hypothetical protein